MRVIVSFLLLAIIISEIHISQAPRATDNKNKGKSKLLNTNPGESSRNLGNFQLTNLYNVEVKDSDEWKIVRKIKKIKEDMRREKRRKIEQEEEQKQQMQQQEQEQGQQRLIQEREALGLRKPSNLHIDLNAPLVPAEYPAEILTKKLLSSASPSDRESQFKQGIDLNTSPSPDSHRLSG